MRLKPDRVVVFGLDDTLYPEADYEASKLEVITEIATQYAGVENIKGSTGDLFDRVLSLVEQMDDALRQDLVECVRQSLPRIRLFPDAEQVLAGLRESCLLAVVADGPMTCQQAKCRALGLDQWADRIVYPDYWGRSFWSPHPRALMSIQNCYGFDSQQCIYVSAGEDSDFQHARRMGWLTIRIQRDPSAPNSAPSATSSPHLEIPTLFPLLGLFDSQQDAA